MPKKQDSRPTAPRLARLFADLPADEQDLKFEFEGLAQTLAELALNPDNRTPFSVVVRGGWGRGKTTLLRRTQRLLGQAEDAVAGQRRVKTLWFNAWKYPSEDTVLAGLLGALIDKMGKGDLLDQVKKAVFEYRGEAGLAVLRLAAPEPLKPLLEMEGRYKPVHEKRAFHDTFRDLFSQISYLLFHGAAVLRDTAGREEEDLWNAESQQKATLAVFLDDLDRCPQERVVEVLEAINLFLDLPGVCFYLGIHWERLVTALPDAVRDHAEEFLEKIVQVSFELPEVSAEDAEEYIRETVAGTLLETVMEPGGGGEELGDVAVIARALDRRHPRHIKRFLNDLSMGLAVLRNTGRLLEPEVGDEEGQQAGDNRVPATAVLAWHLLSEVLPAQRWSEIRALPVNVRAFVREWTEEATKASEEEPEGAERPLAAMRQSGLLARHIEALDGLSDGQLHGLVHLASPPQTELPRRRRPGRVDLVNLDSDAWVPLPEGRFAMGSEDGEPHERPVHPVQLSAFRMSRYPVTNADYARYVQDSGKNVPGHWDDGEVPPGKENHPVVNVSWADAEAFCTWLTKKCTARGDGGRASLPTEAQWEYAARGSHGRTYSWGEDEPTEDHANFSMSVGDTTPVGSYDKGKSPEGVHDLAGNVWEWCEDWYGDYTEDLQVDPKGPDSGSGRVLRGGAFSFGPRGLRGAYRSFYHPGARHDDFGFRVVWLSSGGLD